MKTDLERLVSGLMGVENGSMKLDAHTANQLTLLSLVERTQDAAYELTAKGIEVLRTENLWNGYSAIDQIRLKVEWLIQSKYDDESIGDALWISEYKTLGEWGNMSRVWRYLWKIDPDDVLPTATVLGDTMRILWGVMEWLRDRKNNKVFVRWAGLDQKLCATYIRYGVQNYHGIVTWESKKEFPTLVDLSFIGNIAFNKFVDHDDFDKAVYYTVRYVIYGISHPLLNSRMPNKRMSLVKHTLKEAIDIEMWVRDFHRESFAWKNNIVLVSEPIKWWSEWNKALIREYERNHANAGYRYPEEEDFMGFVANTPCLFINELGSAELRTSREMTMDFAWLPDHDALSIFWASEDEITSTNLRAFVARTTSIAKLKPIGGWTFKASQLEELSWHLLSEDDRIMYMLGYMLDRCDGIDGWQLQALLSLLIDFGVMELSDELIVKIRKRTRLPDELIEKYSIRALEYEPKRYMSNFPNWTGELISDDVTFFSTWAEYIWLGAEIDAIFETLERGEPVVYIDETGYKDPNGENGDYMPISDRVRRGIVTRIMSGDAPDALQNHSVVLIEWWPSEEGSTDLLAQLFWLVTEGEPINLNAIRTELRKFIRYNPRTILILSLNLEGYDAGGIGELIRLVQSMGIKLIIEGKKDIPGTGRSVRTTPITEDDLSDRIIAEIDELCFELWMNIDTRICRKLFMTVARYRKDGDDPLWMTHEILKIAKNSALGRESKELSWSDVSAGVSYVLWVASVASMKENKTMIARLPEILKRRIVGQDDVIDAFCKEFMTHMTGGGNPERPLTYLFPGPTGVGKTLFAEVTSRNFNLPFLSIDGSQYTEAHHGERLSWSPPWYVDSDKSGILTGFMKKHTGRAFVFVDEIDKMHPTNRMRLMNFFDEAKMTDGHGHTYRRPQYTIVVATNAWAENLKPGMTHREILDCIGEAFKDEKWTPKPELASRFRISPMFPVDESSFKRAIRDNLREIELRAKMVANNIEVSEVDDAVVDFIFAKIKDVCQKFGGTNKGMWFTHQVQRSNGYFNLREIVRCIDANMEWEDIPNTPWNYKVVLKNGKINLAPNGKIE